MNYQLRRESMIRQPVSKVFDFFSDAGNLEEITPRWLAFRLLPPRPVNMGAGTRIAYELRIHGITVHWLTGIERWNPPHEFVDVQLRGPYRFWRHTHSFSEFEGGTRMVDTVDYALPFGALGRLVHWLVVRRDVARIFDYRERRIQELLG